MKCGGGQGVVLLQQGEQGHHDPSVWAEAVFPAACAPDPQVASPLLPAQLLCVLLEGRLTTVGIQTSDEITFNSFLGKVFCLSFNYNFFKKFCSDLAVSMIWDESFNFFSILFSMVNLVFSKKAKFPHLCCL